MQHDQGPGRGRPGGLGLQGQGQQGGSQQQQLTQAAIASLASQTAAVLQLHEGYGAALPATFGIQGLPISAGQLQAWPPAGYAYAGPLPTHGQHLQLQAPSHQAMGWGGQTLRPFPGAALGGGDGGRGRGGRSSSAPPRFGGFGGRGGRGRGQGAGRRQNMREADSVMATITAAVRAAQPGQAASEEVLQLLGRLDSRSTAALFKQLSGCGLSRHAWEIFNCLRALPDGALLRGLLDVWTYTAMISLLSNSRDVPLAMELSAEMAQRNVERNVHTWSALMNVCIKAGRNQTALEVYREMLSQGCTPNLVTFNTLIDALGKTGRWAEALRVLDRMHAEGMKPVTRTYNTLMIACNSSNQWQEALAVYDQMLASGLVPNTTTYNALISAHSKSGRLEKVMDVYQEMVAANCERSVITYSSLISACEKAGQWELALQLFGRMHQDNLQPNTITYNSLLTACAQGAQWERAREVFDQMQQQGVQPDVVTYTALISCYERGGQWRMALQAFEEMRRRGCQPDSIIIAAIIDALWDTGIKSVQSRAVALYRAAVAEGHLKQGPAIHRPTEEAAAAVAAAVAAGVEVQGGSGEEDPDSEISLGSQSCSSAVLALLCWLADMRDKVLASGAEVLPEKVVVRFGKSRQRDNGVNAVPRNVVLAWLMWFNSPFKMAHEPSGGSSSRLDAPGDQLAMWLTIDRVAAALKPFAASAVPVVEDSQPLSEQDLGGEAATEEHCRSALTAIKGFEATHCLVVSAMPEPYITNRRSLVTTLLTFGRTLGVPEEVAHDAVLLMDRAMSASLALSQELYLVALAAALTISVRQSLAPQQQPSDEQLVRATGVPVASLRASEATLRSALGGDTSSLSALRALKVYLSRMGYEPLGQPRVDPEVDGDPFSLLQQAICVPEFLNYRPSITAAAVLYAERLRCGLHPSWPTSLSLATSYSETTTPELAAAIAGAQRLSRQLQQVPQVQPPLAGGGAPERRQRCGPHCHR